MMSTSLNTSAAAPAQAAGADQAVQAAQTVSASATATATTAAPAAAAAPAAFAQWLGAQADGGNGATANADSGAAALAGMRSAPSMPSMPSLPSLPSQTAALSAGLSAAFAKGFAAQPPATADAGAATPAAARPAANDAAAATDKDTDSDTDAAQDNSLLAAMAMPLMPLTPMQIAQAVQLAHAGSGSTPGGATGADVDTDARTEERTDTRTSASIGQAGAAIQDSARHAAPASAAAPAPAAAAPSQDDGGTRLAIGSPQIDAANGAANKATGGDAGTRQDSSTAQASAPAPVAGPSLAAAPTTSAPPADSLKLDGPPTAWRQSLQEALGDRLNIQVGKNMEQAVIRLEPPQLGRIDIAIRHSNGTLEVNISASNTEVLRQLQGVSDNLRSDLAQRQYVDVAVSVTPTPKNGGTPFGDPQQQQGRGRQQERAQQEPGRALAEAGNPSSVFSLGGRE